MEKSTNQILFNRSSRNEFIKKNAQNAKTIIQLMIEHESNDPQVPMSIINLYSNKIQTSTRAISNKIKEDKLRAFEFFVIQN